MIDEITRIATDAIEVSDKDIDRNYKIGYLTGALKAIVKEVEKQKNTRDD